MASSLTAVASAALSWMSLLNSSTGGGSHSASLQPMSLSISPKLGVVAVGSRDCPVNDASSLFFFNLEDGKKLGEEEGLGQCALARQAPSLSKSVACTGWNKPDGKTTVLGPSEYAYQFAGEPAMMTTTAITSGGELAAFLWEVDPDLKHRNNRSGTLTLVDGDHGKKLQSFQVPGQGASDPQSVSMSAKPNKHGVYTVGTVFGSVNSVIEYDLNKKSAQELWRKPGLEVDIAISARGEAFAITSGGGYSVDVYFRENAGFSLLANIPSPQTVGRVVQPITLIFDRADDKDSLFFSIAWTDQVGSLVVLSAHEIDKSSKTVKPVWTFMPNSCPGTSQFDYIMQPDLAISGGGEVVALGLWGCDEGEYQSGQVVALKGRGGNGNDLLLNATLAGEVWAVDVDMAEGTGEVYVGAGSWKNKNGSIPARVSLYKLKL